MRRLFSIKNKVKDETGSVIVVVAFSMTLLFALAALVVDLGMAYYRKCQLQAALDAASLAGAYELKYDANTSQADRDADLADAKNKAMEYFKKNWPYEIDESVIESKINIALPYSTHYTASAMGTTDYYNAGPIKGNDKNVIEVTYRDSVKTGFAAIIGYDYLDIGCVAQAINAPGVGDAGKAVISNNKLNITSGGGTIIGGVHSNADVVISRNYTVDGASSANGRVIDEYSYGNWEGGQTGVPAVSLDTELKPYDNRCALLKRKLYLTQSGGNLVVTRLPEITIRASWNGQYMAEDEFGNMVTEIPGFFKYEDNVITLTNCVANFDGFNNISFANVEINGSVYVDGDLSLQYNIPGSVINGDLYVAGEFRAQKDIILGINVKPNYDFADTVGANVGDVISSKGGTIKCGGSVFAEKRMTFTGGSSIGYSPSDFDYPSVIYCTHRASSEWDEIGVHFGTAMTGFTGVIASGSRVLVEGNGDFTGSIVGNTVTINTGNAKITATSFGDDDDTHYLRLYK